MAEVKWIKIVTDIFDDEKILLIESMPEADALIVIWFKLLCLAGKHNNKGVFTLNDRIPYTEEMLSTIFRRQLNVVRLALKTFEMYGMIEIINGVITIPNWAKHQTLDAIDKKREYQRTYMAGKRAEQKLLVCNTNCESNCETNSESNVSTIEGDIEGEEDIDKDIEEEIEPSQYDPTLKVPWEEIISAWNSLPSPVAQIRGLTESRKDKVRTRIKNLSLLLIDILKAIKNIDESSFCKGCNEKGWVITFDWLFKNDTNFNKVLEGNYKDKPKQQKALGQNNVSSKRQYDVEALEKQLLGRG